MHALSFGFCWNLWFRRRFPATCWDASSSSAYKAQSPPSVSPTSSLRFSVVSLNSPSSREIKKCLSVSEHCRALVLRSSIDAFPVSVFNMPDHISSNKPSGLVVAWICVSRLLDQKIGFGGLHTSVNFVDPVHESNKFRSTSTFQ